MAHTKVHELEAFCATCPSAEEVTHLLQAVGFTLAFHMEAVRPPVQERPLFLPNTTTRIKMAVK